ncbi:transmembrane protease serine 9 [Amyelois transitella]|uniref:transmembrane protease serine 9 n=1 Tax=Amyelois transitella TaxID=680683 RepID=UPI0029901369|nr:transmembrane protease serine 9 [Amyelois transitella]
MIGHTSFVFLLTLSVTTVLADPLLAFPEEARNGARIVSGWEAEEGQFPFQLSLRMVNREGGVTACGGSIIHAEWAITAAHCTATRVSVVVRAGAVNLTRPYYIFETTEYYNHPLYIEALQGIVQPNDIGVVKFNRRIEFNDRVQPIRLHRSEDRNRNYDGVRLTASGWGRTWTNGASPENLNWVYLRGVTNAACLAAFGGGSIIQPSTICARGYNDTTQSICQGDSGGPLTVVDEDGVLSLVGVSSFVSGTGCHTDFPAGFIRPGHYHDWYLEVTGIDFDWEEYEVSTTTTTTPLPDTTIYPGPNTTYTVPDTTLYPGPNNTTPAPNTTYTVPDTTLYPGPNNTTPAPNTTYTVPDTTLYPGPNNTTPAPNTTYTVPDTTLYPGPNNTTPAPNTTYTVPDTTLYPGPNSTTPAPNTTYTIPDTTLYPGPNNTTPAPNTTYTVPDTTLYPGPNNTTPAPNTTYTVPDTTLYPGPNNTTPAPNTTYTVPDTTLYPGPNATYPEIGSTVYPVPNTTYAVPDTTIIDSVPETKMNDDDETILKWFKSKLLFF